MKAIVALGLTVWLALVVALGASGVMLRPRGTPPLPILISVLGPIAVFLAAYFGSRAFRALVLNADLRFLTAIQAWRIGGFAFVVLTLHGFLPGSFAWPAGLGDIAVGVTAPWVMLALLRRPAFVTSPPYMAWNVFGILDLVVAVGMGALNSWLMAGDITTAPMARMPLVLIPAYLVPLFVMLHLTAVFRARRSELADRGAADRTPERRVAPAM